MFAAWTDPDQIVQWFGPDGVSLKPMRSIFGLAVTLRGIVRLRALRAFSSPGKYFEIFDMLCGFLSRSTPESRLFHVVALDEKSASEHIPPMGIYQKITELVGQNSQSDESSGPRRAVLYRMVMDNHLCPYGLKSKWLLERKGYEVRDHRLVSRDQTDAFKAEHGVKSTPQTFIGGERVGGYDDLRAWFADDGDNPDKKTYTPVLMIFAVCALMAAAVSWGMVGNLFSVRTVELFAAFSMTALALQKLKDVESFSTMFLNYDLLAQRRVGYGYLYPFAEAAAGILMIAGGALGLIASPIALFIGTVGAISVYKAVYIDKRELKCACVGGDSNVPLGFVSLTENLVMMAMGVWMPVKTLLL